MPLRIFSSRVLSAANATMFLLGAAMFGMWFFSSLYLQQVLGYSPLQAGLAFLPMTLMIIIGSTLASRAVSRLGVRPLLVGGMLAETAGLVLFATVSPGGTYLGDVLAPSLIVAAGIGLSFVPITIAAVSGVSHGEAGLASGIVNTSRLMGGGLGLAILATLATSRTHGDLRVGAALHGALTDGFQLAFAVGAGFAFAGAVVALLALRRSGSRPVGQAHGGAGIRALPLAGRGRATGARDGFGRWRGPALILGAILTRHREGALERLPGDQARSAAVGHEADRPADEHEQPVLKADQVPEMDQQPRQPRQ